MKSIEKPFEYLSEKEKQILQLCQKIILWGTESENARSPYSLELKNKATDLYERLNNTNFNNDDKYYKFHEEYDNLKEHFERVKEIKFKDKKIEGEIRKVLDESKKNFDSGENINLVMNWKCDQGAYGDYLDINIEHDNNKIRLMVKKMDDSFIYEDDLAKKITEVFKKNKLKYKYTKEEHSGASAIEHDFECEAENFEAIGELIYSIMEIAQKVERKFKEHKKSKEK